MPTEEEEEEAAAAATAVLSINCGDGDEEILLLMLNNNLLYRKWFTLAMRVGSWLLLRFKAISPRKKIIAFS